MPKAKSEDQNNQTVNGDDVVGTGNEERLKKLAQINDQNDSVLAKEGDLADVNDDDTTSEFKIDKNLSDEEITQRELERAEAEANAKADDDTSEPSTQTEPEKIKIKINGVEQEVTQEELIELAQKSKGAEEKFKEAARLKREAEEAAKTDSQPSNKDVAEDALEERRALVRAIQMGTEDEAMAAIEKLQSSNPSVSADDVARTVDERLTFNDAVTRFQSEYPDLVSDPMLLNVVLQRDKDLLEQGDKRTYWERYDEIGKEVRAWKDSFSKPTTEENKPSDKQTRKASASTVPKGAGAKAPAVVDDEDKEESVGDVISAMAKSRGGPQWLRG